MPALLVFINIFFAILVGLYAKKNPPGISGRVFIESFPDTAGNGYFPSAFQSGEKV